MPGHQMVKQELGTRPGSRVNLRHRALPCLEIGQRATTGSPTFYSLKAHLASPKAGGEAPKWPPLKGRQQCKKEVKEGNFYLFPLGVTLFPVSFSVVQSQHPFSLLRHAFPHAIYSIMSPIGVFLTFSFHIASVEAQELVVLKTEGWKSLPNSQLSELLLRQHEIF